LRLHEEESWRQKQIAGVNLSFDWRQKEESDDFLTVCSGATNEPDKPE